MIKAIIFDFDDTLVKTLETKAQALIAVGKLHYNIVITFEDVKKHWGKPFKQYMNDLYLGIDNVDNIIEKYTVERIAYPTPVYENTIETLNKLSHKYLLGIVSSLTEKYIKKDMKSVGISENLFFIIQTEEHTKVHKPNPHVFDYLTNKLKLKGINKSEILYVGDHLTDFFAAQGAGFQFYGFTDRTTTKDQFIQAGAKTLNNISDLLKIF